MEWASAASSDIGEELAREIYSGRVAAGELNDWGWEAENDALKSPRVRADPNVLMYRWYNSLRRSALLASALSEVILHKDCTEEIREIVGRALGYAPGGSAKEEVS